MTARYIANLFTHNPLLLPMNATGNSIPQNTYFAKLAFDYQWFNTFKKCPVRLALSDLLVNDLTKMFRITGNFSQISLLSS